MISASFIASHLCLRTLPGNVFVKQSYATGAIASLGKSKGKLKGKIGAAAEKVKLPVETDAKRLVKYLCGSNIQAEGGQEIELKPDNEYPEWLWKLHIGKNKSLEELDPNTLDYWQKVRSLAIRRNHRLSKQRKF
ncbi:39S ribosomal protein L54, mitochondrial-like [Macrosteles quadrilineatus]|uniref:39S ribosomal protein L54, mitochondrial-like n=1 Tax=Macrosteles quadrilineatus TaxID=74068 RepID=UPI0023E1AAC3|nr:39S ribosomal protein L54, mitochondrial-like [Macrosteles quadrilineatus]